MGSVIASVNVGVAVGVDVHNLQGQAFAVVLVGTRRGAQPGFLGHIGEGAVTVVFPQCMWPRLELLGWADVAGNSDRVAAALWVIVPRPVHVLADVEIGITVAVEISPGCAGAPEVRPRLAGL